MNGTVNSREGLLQSNGKYCHGCVRKGIVRAFGGDGKFRPFLASVGPLLNIKENSHIHGVFVYLSAPGTACICTRAEFEVSVKIAANECPLAVLGLRSESKSRPVPTTKATAMNCCRLFTATFLFSYTFP